MLTSSAGVDKEIRLMSNRYLFSLLSLNLFFIAGYRRGYAEEYQTCMPNEKLGFWYRVDLLVDDQIIVELKAKQQIAPIHKAQL